MTGWRKRQVVDMAREAGFEQVGHDSFQEFTARIERFAALVIANYPPQSYMTWQEGYEAGKQAEREACAKVCDRFANRMMSAEECADAIRARGQA